jgi:hypothetical protein
MVRVNDSLMPGTKKHALLADCGREGGNPRKAAKVVFAQKSGATFARNQTNAENNSGTKHKKRRGQEDFSRPLCLRPKSNAGQAQESIFVFFNVFEIEAVFTKKFLIPINIDTFAIFDNQTGGISHIPTVSFFSLAEHRALALFTIKEIVTPCKHTPHFLSSFIYSRNAEKHSCSSGNTVPSSTCPSP